MCVYHSVVGHFSEYDRGIKRARFAVLRLTKIPAVLVEGGFLTERGESRLIAQSAWREKLAQSIATGIINYKGLVDHKTRPMMVADYRHEFDGQLVLKDAKTPVKPEAVIRFRSSFPRATDPVPAGFATGLLRSAQSRGPITGSVAGSCYS